jgi:type IV fimbrial biogenesis protein FimT
MRKENGFTLIELLTAIGLAALLLSMAVPALDSFTRNARQTGTVNDFVASMHIARSTAVTTNARVTICASSGGNVCEAVGWNQGWIVFSDSNSNQTVDGSDAIVATGAGSDELTIRSAEFAGVMVFRPNGRVIAASVNGNSGQFTVCDDRGEEHAKVLIIELSGRPRLSHYRADGTVPDCA